MAEFEFPPRITENVNRYISSGLWAGVAIYLMGGNISRREFFRTFPIAAAAGIAGFHADDSVQFFQKAAQNADTLVDSLLETEIPDILSGD